jgi:hypothetical protein
MLLHRLVDSTSLEVVGSMTQPFILTCSATASQSTTSGQASAPSLDTCHGIFILVALSILLLIPPIFLLCILITISLFIVLMDLLFLLLDMTLFIMTLFIFLMFPLFPT